MEVKRKRGHPPAPYAVATLGFRVPKDLLDELKAKLRPVVKASIEKYKARLKSQAVETVTVKNMEKAPL